MKLEWTKPFENDYRKLPSKIQKTADKQLEFLLYNFRHPSLHTKKLKSSKGDTWGARITRNYRFTFQIQGKSYVLRRIGKHKTISL